MAVRDLIELTARRQALRRYTHTAGELRCKIEIVPGHQPWADYWDNAALFDVVEELGPESFDFR
jgi:hypothetical protein